MTMAMASPSQGFSLSLSLDSSLKPFLSPSARHSHSLPSLPGAAARRPLLCSPSPLPQTTTTFVSPLSVSKLRTLSEFSRTHHFPHADGNGNGDDILLIRPMVDTEIDAVSELLSDSFIQTLLLPSNYAKLLAFLIKNYLLDRRALLPHAALLVGFYSPHDQPDAQLLACTAEISFNERGANAALPTPVPPPDCPYICNMTVKESFRRKGIGKQLLGTCEDLITKMTDKRDVYLHCRMVDKVPLRMYKKAGYKVVKTDSLLVWLTLQRRKHLMRKQLLHATDSEPPKSEQL